MPKVSVIIPVYKAAAFLPATLDSVLAQTLADFEVLCVDDCSPDNSVEIIEKYAKQDKRLRLRRHAQNQGAPAYGRNTGIQAAKGEYLTFLDHDDTFLPEKLAKLSEALEKEKVDFICSNIYLLNARTGRQDGLAWGEIVGDPKKGFAKRLLRGNFVPPNSTLMRSSVFKKAGLFDTSLKGADDFDMWYRIARLFPCTVYNQPLATWRYLSQSSLSANNRLMIEDELRMYEKIIRGKEWRREEKEEAKRGVQRNQKHLANRYLLEKEYQRAGQLYQEAGVEWVGPFLSAVPGLFRRLYQIKNRSKKFTPLTLNFEV